MIEFQCKSGKQKLEIQKEVAKSIAKRSTHFQSIFVVVIPSGISYNSSITFTKAMKL